MGDLATKVSGDKNLLDFFKAVAEGQFRAWQLKTDFPSFTDTVVILQNLGLIATYASPENNRNEIVFLTDLGNGVMKKLHGSNQTALFEGDASRDPRALVDLVGQYFSELGFELAKRRDATGRFLFVAGYARIHAFVASGRGS